MFDVWTPEHSVLREKVLEHIFLSELAKAMLLRLRMPFEVLRSEFDGHGYDVVIEALGVVRHVQLKATRTGGKRATVDVNLALARKPSGCVVWFMVDEATLQIGPFLWLGDRPGQPLPAPEGRPARHSRGNAAGVKGVRPGLIEIPKRAFIELDTMTEVARAMFEAPDATHLALLRSHLASRGHALDEVNVDRRLGWLASAGIAEMVDGYELALSAGLGDPIRFADAARARAEAGEGWQGTVLELWVQLFLEHRRDHFSGLIGVDVTVPHSPALDELCERLTALIRATQAGH